MAKGSFQSLLSVLALLGLAMPAVAVDNLTAAPSQADKERLARAPKQLPQTPEQIRGEQKQLQTELLLKPNDAQLHFKLGETHRKLGQTRQAEAEYLKACELDQCLWVAYHQLSTICNDESILDQTIERLSKLEKEKPRELLLRVALSEMYEKRGNYQQAARTLIDLTYANAVPEKFRLRVSSRIHNMLTLAKTQHQQVENAAVTAVSEDELDVMPAPLPTPNTKRSIAQAKLKDSKEVRGVGHTNLLP